MAGYLKKAKNEIGLSPQELLFRGNQKIDQVLLRIIDFDASNVDEKDIIDVKEAATYDEKKTVTWLNIDGLHDLNLLKEIGEAFQLSNLLLSDVLETNARPRIHDYGNWIFISLKMLQFDEQANKISIENLSIVFNDSLLISFQEKKGDVFDPVRERIRSQKRTLRSSRPDYLAFALLDTVIDHYLYILSVFGEKIECFDDVLVEEPNKSVLESINSYKKELNYIRKGIKPAKEMILALTKLESDFIYEKNDIHFKELLNNMNQVSDTSDSYRELLSDQLIFII